jgi:hypothetical protein
MCTSRLSRHVGSLDLKPVSLNGLAWLAEHMPHLRDLRCTLWYEWSSLVFPARLRSLSISFISNPEACYTSPYSDEAQRDFDNAIRTCASLPQLESLTLTSKAARRCDLKPLAQAPSLRSLKLEVAKYMYDPSSVIESLRTLSNLRSLTFKPMLEDLKRLLQMPHKLKLEQLNVHEECTFAAEFGDILTQLPTLTDLDLLLRSAHTDFLCQLPHLRRLVVNCGKCEVQPDEERIARSWHALTKLTDLRIDGSNRWPVFFTTEQLAAALAHMPQLNSLQLRGPLALDSLRFLSAGPTPRSLKELELARVYPLPLSELSHVHALSALTKLTLEYVFDAPLDESLYTPPSALMPTLQRFHHAWESDEWESDEEEEGVGQNDHETPFAFLFLSLSRCCPVRFARILVYFWHCFRVLRAFDSIRSNFFHSSEAFTQ